MSEKLQAWRYAPWPIQWRSGALVLALGFAGLGAIMGGAAWWFQLQTKNIGAVVPARFPPPALNAADDRTPHWSLAAEDDAQDQARINEAMRALAAKGDAAYDPPGGSQ